MCRYLSASSVFPASSGPVRMAMFGSRLRDSAGGLTLRSMGRRMFRIPCSRSGRGK